MSGQDCEVLYAKYNTARRPDFRVATEICKRDDGLFVRKRASDALARAHLKHIYENTVSLQDYYRDMHVISAELWDGELRFPYIRGKTLAEMIDTQRFVKERFISQVNQMLDTVLGIRTCYAVRFERTEGFDTLFGKVEIEDGIPAVNPANLDALLTNFIQSDEAIYCIDCEWVFRYPVPIDYIRYRVLLYLYVNKGYSFMEGITLEEMLGWFGFTEGDCERYRQMEDAFQQYVHGENRKYFYTESYRRKNEFLDGINQEMQLLRLDCLVKAGTIHDHEAQIGDMKHVIGDLQEHIADKERYIQSQNAQMAEKDAQIAQKDEQLANKEEQLACKDTQLASKDEQLVNMSAQIQALSQDYQTISNSFFWRVTKPARVVLDGIKRIAKRNNRLYTALRAVKRALHPGSHQSPNRD